MDSLKHSPKAVLFPFKLPRRTKEDKTALLYGMESTVARWNAEKKLSAAS